MIIHIDYSTGASGDKTLGALLELAEVLGLTTFAELQALIAQLLPDAAVCLHREKVVRGSVNASYLSVAEDAPPWRRWSQIRTLLEDAGASGLLGERTAARALTVFEAIAVAEAEVHGVELEQVHFHEIGAADSVVDIVGCCWLLERLAPSAVLATPLALGSGTVSFSHGTLPVPAPATARLVTGLPVCTGPLICGSSDADRDREGEGGAVGGHRDAGGHRDGSSVVLSSGELTTPTGAALARVLVDRFEPLPPLRVAAVGYGAGQRELPGWANVTRALAGEAVPLLSDTASLTIEQVTLLETNIDHRTPEALAFACEELLAAGALDVWQEAITMKKGRLAVRLSVLSAPAEAQRLCDDLVAQTGSLGVRVSMLERAVVAREPVVLHTSYGNVPFKAAALWRPGEERDWLRPEHDAVARIARERGLRYQEVYDALVAGWRRAP